MKILKKLFKKIKNFLFFIYLRANHVEGAQSSFSIGGKPIFKNAGIFLLGQRVAFRSFRTPCTIEVGHGGKLLIGDDVFINDGVNIYCGQGIIIGAHTKIGDWVTIYDSDFHPVGPQDCAAVRPVSIGQNVWIGARAMILAGSQIGDHAVIGAGSVVRGVVPARSVVSGIPAQAVRQFDCADDWVRP